MARQGEEMTNRDRAESFGNHLMHTWTMEWTEKQIVDYEDRKVPRDLRIPGWRNRACQLLNEKECGE